LELGTQVKKVGRIADDAIFNKTSYDRLTNIVEQLSMKARAKSKIDRKKFSECRLTLFLRFFFTKVGHKEYIFEIAACSRNIMLDDDDDVDMIGLSGI
jgi:hypothetical protein